MIFAYSASLPTAEKAAREAGIPSDRVVILDSPERFYGEYSTLEGMVAEGLAKLPTFEERKLNPGEGKIKIRARASSPRTIFHGDMRLRKPCPAVPVPYARNLHSTTPGTSPGDVHS